MMAGKFPKPPWERRFRLDLGAGQAPEPVKRMGAFVKPPVPALEVL
jgi:hypothetical protein